MSKKKEEQMAALQSRNQIKPSNLIGQKLENIETATNIIIFHFKSVKMIVSGKNFIISTERI